MDFPKLLAEFLCEGLVRDVRRGYPFVEVWDCQWKRLCKEVDGSCQETVELCLRGETGKSESRQETGKSEPHQETDESERRQERVESESRQERVESGPGGKADKLGPSGKTGGQSSFGNADRLGSCEKRPTWISEHGRVLKKLASELGKGDRLVRRQHPFMANQDAFFERGKGEEYVLFYLENLVLNEIYAKDWGFVARHRIDSNVFSKLSPEGHDLRRGIFFECVISGVNRLCS